MRRDGKLSMALHLLVHLVEAAGHPVTSERLAEHFRTNPVVIRRALAGLRAAGIVGSAKGHGGGWVLARPAREVTLGQVYAALGERPSVAPTRDEPVCLIQRAVDAALAGAYAEADALLLRRLDDVTLADLAADYEHRRAGACVDPARHAQVTASG